MLKKPNLFKKVTSDEKKEIADDVEIILKLTEEERKREQSHVNAILARFCLTTTFIDPEYRHLRDAIKERTQKIKEEDQKGRDRAIVSGIQKQEKNFDAGPIHKIREGKSFVVIGHVYINDGKEKYKNVDVGFAEIGILHAFTNPYATNRARKLPVL